MTRRVETVSSRSIPVHQDEELRLPRPPGVIRRFWARHPLFTDILITLVCLLFAIVPGTSDGAGVRIGSVFIPLAGTIGCLLLMFRRRRWPVVVFVAAMLASASYLFAVDGVGGMLLLVASYGLAVYRSGRACWIALGVGIGALALLAMSLSLTGAVTWGAGVSTVFSQAVFALIGALIGVNVGNRKRYLEAVIDRSRQLLTERDQSAQLASAAERERIAREMHDIVSHSLTVVVALSEG
ncbi:MAG: histidine kinase dimerization/phosphoacceptor domain-containing protein, partial [Microbacterium sp.]